MMYDTEWLPNDTAKLKTRRGDILRPDNIDTWTHHYTLMTGWAAEVVVWMEDTNIDRETVEHYRQHITKFAHAGEELHRIAVAATRQYRLHVL